MDGQKRPIKTPLNLKTKTSALAKKPLLRGKKMVNKFGQVSRQKTTTQSKLMSPSENKVE
jgi:hypothetical protein